MNYLLDTDTCIYLMTEREPKKRERIVTHLEAVKVEETVYLSSITVSELSYGAWSKANVALLERFLMDFTVAAFVPLNREIDCETMVKLCVPVGPTIVRVLSVSAVAPL